VARWSGEMECLGPLSKCLYWVEWRDGVSWPAKQVSVLGWKNSVRVARPFATKLTAY
jgi:hypothetical protein